MKRSLIVFAAVWAVALTGLGYWSLRHGKPTIREETTIAQALPTVDGALGRIASTMDAQDIPVLGGYLRVGGDCRITAARSGARYQRVLDVYLREGTEAGFLDAIKAAAPADWKTSVLHADGVQTLQADAGNFVAIRGALLMPGQVRIIADTGCRPMPHPLGTASPVAGGQEQTAAQGVFDALKLTPGAWTVNELSCATGGTVRTAQATAPTVPAKLLDQLKARPGTVVLARDQIYAAGTPGKPGVVARALDGHLLVAASTGCRGQ